MSSLRPLVLRVLPMSAHHAVTATGGGHSPRPFLPRAALLAVAAAAGALAAEAPAPAGVRRHAVTPPVDSYLVSAAWLPGEERLLVPDPRHQRLLVFSRQGGAPQVVTALPGWERPLTGLFTAWSEGGTTHLVVNDWERRETWTMRLGPDLQASRTTTFSSNTLDPPGYLPRLRFQLTVGQWHYAQAGFMVGEQSDHFGVCRISVAPPHRVEFLVEYPLATGARVLTDDVPLLARIGDQLFFLQLGADPPYLQQLAPTRRRLEAFPPGYGSPPDAPPGVQGRDAAWAHLTAMETSFMPTGLYARGRWLLLLTRQPLGGGKTQWRLHRLDPVRDRLEGSFELPTTAPEILIAPGEKRWAIVELGPLQGVMERPTASWVEVPGELLDRPWPTPTAAPRVTPPRP